MPHYYFHIREGGTLTRDALGQELPDAEAARDKAITTGRALLDERQGRSRPTIEIADETGHVVDEVSSRDILFYDLPGYAAAQPAARNSPPK
ncbi:MAG TPA: hypothetical protein VN175_08510 [Rhizomicrobium sp.]|nr:hypothetical protein [Rhizomicrobium sp.]